MNLGSERIEKKYKINISHGSNVIFCLTPKIGSSIDNNNSCCRQSFGLSFWELIQV